MKLITLPTAASQVERLDTGVEVKNTPDVNSLSAARAVVQELRRHGFDAANVASIERAQPPTVWIVVEHRPLGPQGEAKLRAERPGKK
jgi:hypothetical protein